LGSESRAPVRQLVNDWYESLRCYVDPGRALYISTRRTTGYLGAESRAPSQVFAAYLEEFDAALVEGVPQVVTTRDNFDIRFDRTAAAGDPPEGEVIFTFRRYAEVSEEVLAFLADRLKVALRDQGKRHDLVDAVYALGDDDLVRIVARVEALSDFLVTEDGANLLAGYKRATNILKSEEKKGALPEGDAAPMAGASEEELALIEAVHSAEPKVVQAINSEDFAAAMRALSGLRGPVDAFFEKVLVNSQVPAERENRLKLLIQVRDAMGRVADFGQVNS
jgi:glycyl-tRNA synthetase beta chain